MAEMTNLHSPQDSARVLNPCQQAADDVRQETGTNPELAHVQETMTDAPPSVPADRVWCRCHDQDTGALDRPGTGLKRFFSPNDWYLGPRVLAPLARGQGLGERLARHIIQKARADRAACFRFTVLNSNPYGRAFWTRLGLLHEKSTRDGGGRLRHVHRLDLGSGDHV